MKNKYWCTPTVSDKGEDTTKPLTLADLNATYEEALKTGPPPNLIDLSHFTPEEREVIIRKLACL